MLILIFEGSCVTQYNVAFDDHKDFLVVEGLVTNEDRSHYVKLTTSDKVGTNREFNPVTGATVIISDNWGTEAVLIEKDPGFYYTDSTTFITEIGNSYTLRISKANESYVSRPMLLKEVPEITSLYSTLENKQISQLSKSELGYQVYFDTYDIENLCDFYRWEYIETYEIQFPHYFDYPHVVNDVCWVTSKSEEIMIENTAALSQNVIDKRPLIYINNDTERLNVKYSILLRQYSMSEEEYYYWENLKKINSEMGGLYDPIPMHTQGNILAENDPMQKVLGFFSVSSVDEERMFIKNDTLIMPGFYDFCIQDTLRTLDGVDGLGTELWVVTETEGPTLYLTTTLYGCVDCTTRGTNVKPSFWEDDSK